MRNALFAVLLAAAASAPAQASPFDDLITNLAQSTLKPFAQDFGGLIGATDFHSARVPKLGGFDVGLVGAVQSQPSTDNVALNAAGVDAFGLPLLRVEAGLPLGFSVFARGIGVQSASIIGGGVRYQLYRSGLVMAIPDVAVSAAYDKLTHDNVSLGHFGASVQASFNIPIVKPFAGVGFDTTKATVETNAGPVNLQGVSATGSGARFTLGASVTPFPFTYLQAAYQNLHGESGFSFGLGVRFGGLI
jgi:hypothetical protein